MVTEKRFFLVFNSVTQPIEASVEDQRKAEEVGNVPEQRFHGSAVKSRARHRHSGKQNTRLAESI